MKYAFERFSFIDTIFIFLTLSLARKNIVYEIVGWFVCDCEYVMYHSGCENCIIILTMTTLSTLQVIM